MCEANQMQLMNSAKTGVICDPLLRDRSLRSVSAPRP
jgi:hypothetical protein